MVRNIFLNGWKEALRGYESYVIVPENGDSWFEGMHLLTSLNILMESHFQHLTFTGSYQESVFDSLAFLSDQPQANLPFLSAFVETQIFAAFIDSKLTTLLSQPNFVTCFDRVMGFQRKLAYTDDLVSDANVSSLVTLKSISSLALLKSRTMNITHC